MNHFPNFFVGEVKKKTPSSNKFNHQVGSRKTSSPTWITTEDHRPGPRCGGNFCRKQGGRKKARKQQRVPPCHGVGCEEFCLWFFKVLFLDMVHGEVSFLGKRF